MSGLALSILSIRTRPERKCLSDPFFAMQPGQLFRSLSASAGEGGGREPAIDDSVYLLRSHAVQSPSLEMVRRFLTI